MFDAFKKWKAMVENKTNLKMKCLKSNNKGNTLMMISSGIVLKMGLR